MTFKVSQSKVKTKRKCDRAYYYRYIEKIRKKVKSRPLQFGTMVHEMLERFCNEDDPFEYLDDIRDDVKQMKIFAAQMDEFGNILDDVEDIMVEYFRYYNFDRDLRFMRKKGRAAEHTFEIELFPDVIWNGKIDNIVRANGLRWLGEHKTFSRKPSDDDRWRNLQSTTYFVANDIMGWPQLDGAMWDYIKSKPPAEPGTLKDGSFSQKNIDTLPSRVERVLRDNDEDVEDYPGLMANAQKNRSNYFDRVFTPVSPEVAHMTFKDFEATIIQMIDAEEDPDFHWSMNIDRHCSWCDYEPLCRARLQSLDYDYTKEREFTHAKKNDTKEKPVVHKVTHKQVTSRQKGKGS